jgi:hypothetical protein
MEKAVMRFPGGGMPLAENSAHMAGVWFHSALARV